MTNISTPNQSVVAPEQWDQKTRLDALGITFWPQVVQELFAVLPPALALQQGRTWPETLGDLVAQTGQTFGEVKQIFVTVLNESVDIEIDAGQLAKLQSDGANIYLLDVRTRHEFAAGHLPGSLLLQDIDFTALLPKFVAADSVVCVCAHGIRSVSAAMYLRRLGVSSAVSLRGGLGA